ncbi:MAG: NAD(P)-dependent oxidoreductase [Minisyncoccia bacterium]
MKIGFFELEGWEKEVIKNTFAGHDLYFSSEKISEDSLPTRRDFDIISIFVNSQITTGVLDAFPNLKLLTTNSTGFDHINISACKTKGVAVGYVPGYGNNTVAEFAFGLILNLTRKIYQAINQIKERELFSFEGLRGIDLKGKNIGIIGTGRIGKEMVKISKGFGMNVSAFDLFKDEAAAKEMGFSYLSLEDLLKQSDVISVHLPLTEETHHLINMKNVGLIKKGAYFVNTARGPIVETAALVFALQSGVLAGAGLDVLEEEGAIKDEMKFLGEAASHEEELKIMLENHVLMRMPNVLITPHNAFNSNEALLRILNTTFENINGFLTNNRNPKNFVA